MRQTGRQLFSACRNHESDFDGYLQRNVKRKQVKRKRSEASFQSFQLQFEVIVLAVLLASSSEQVSS